MVAVSFENTDKYNKLTKLNYSASKNLSSKDDDKPSTSSHKSLHLRPQQISNRIPYFVTLNMSALIIKGVRFKQLMHTLEPMIDTVMLAVMVNYGTMRGGGNGVN